MIIGLLISKFSAIQHNIKSFIISYETCCGLYKSLESIKILGNFTTILRLDVNIETLFLLIILIEIYYFF